MKKHSLLIGTLILYCNISIAQNQTHAKLVEETAEGICSCVQLYTKGIDKDVQNLLIKIFSYQKKNDRDAFLAFFETVDEALKLRMQEQMVFLEKNKATFDPCINEKNKALKSLVKDDPTLEKKLQTEINDYLSKKENCQFAAALTGLDVQ